MVDVEHPVILDRSSAYKADEISFINFVVSNYATPILPSTSSYANQEFDKFTNDEIARMRRELSDECLAQKIVGKAKGDYINAVVKPYAAQRLVIRDEEVARRTIEIDQEF